MKLTNRPARVAVVGARHPISARLAMARAFVDYDAEVRGGSIAHIGFGKIKVIW